MKQNFKTLCLSNYDSLYSAKMEAETIYSRLGGLVEIINDNGKVLKRYGNKELAYGKYNR